MLPVSRNASYEKLTDQIKRFQVWLRPLFFANLKSTQSDENIIIITVQGVKRNQNRLYDIQVLPNTFIFQNFMVSWNILQINKFHS